MICLLVAGGVNFAQSFSSAYRTPLADDMVAAAGRDNPASYYFNKYKVLPDIKLFNNVDGLSTPFWGVANVPIGKELVNAKNTASAFRMPFFTNLNWPTVSSDSLVVALEGLNKLLLSERGLSFGLYPYWILNRREAKGESYADNFYLSVTTEFTGRYNRVEVVKADEVTNILQLRTGIGIDMGFLLPSKNFATLNVSVNYSTLSEDIRERFRAEDFVPLLLEASVMIPIEFNDTLYLLGIEGFASPRSEPGVGVGILVPLGIKP